MANGGSAFGQTFQYITAVKLHELEQQREICVQYVQDTLAQAKAAEDPISRLDILLSRIQGWTGTGLAPLTAPHIHLENFEAWLRLARHDPSISHSQVSGWISTLDEQLNQAVTRYDYAKLFGDLLKEWLESGDSLAIGQSPVDDEAHAIDSPNSESQRSERIEQRDRIQSLIFEAKRIDTVALEAYLNDLFTGTPEATNALNNLRSQLRTFGDELNQEYISDASMEPLIKSLLSRDLLSAEKTAILKSFLENKVILREVASVLSMQLARLDSWEWPEEGAFVEMRRHLSGKYRAYMDTEIIQALLFQYIGMKWSITMKNAFREVVESRAWKNEIDPLTRHQFTRRQQFGVDILDSVEGVSSGTKIRGRSQGRGRGRATSFGVDWGQNPDWAPEPTIQPSAAPLVGSIEAQRKTMQLDQFFMTQLPDTIEGTTEYDAEPTQGDPGEGQKPNPGLNAQQVLLRLVSTEAHLRKVLYGSCTIMRADLEWFGPSLPHESILTVFRFFGMSDKWLKWFEKWLAAKLRFDNSPEVRMRARGVPIAHALSVMCGEAILFGMDFAVNQHAEGLYVYRIYDDFWYSSQSGSLCATAWREMNKYAALVGISFNAKKTGGVCVGGELEPSLPRGAVSWGFLVFDAGKRRFAVDELAVDGHIQELKRQLAKPKSVFGYVNALNKYLEFFRRNFGQPSHCFGQVHVDEVIQTFERIQRAVFEDFSGSVVDKIRSMVAQRFGVTNIPAGWCYFPVSEGGLEIVNPIIHLLSVRDSLVSSPDREFLDCTNEDKEMYEQAKENWINEAGARNEHNSPTSFMPFEEYILGRENRLAYWGNKWKHMQEVALPVSLTSPEGYPGFLKPAVESWIVALHAPEIKAVFGGLKIVEPTLIPVGMLSVFRTAKIAWDS